LEGESKKAIETLKTVKNYVGNSGRYDKMALRKSETILASSNPSAGLISTAFELLYFKRDIAHMMEEHLSKVQQTMEKITSSFDPQKDLKTLKKESLPNIASSLVIEGAVWAGLGDKEKAKICFEKTITMEKLIPDVGKHWMVSALYELGEMYFRSNDFEKANEFITRASSYSNYDWEDVYKSRLSKARSQIKKIFAAKEKEKK
jgi:tetratricopeptide (TPR) repeat protein